MAKHSVQQYGFDLIFIRRIKHFLKRLFGTGAEVPLSLILVLLFSALYEFIGYHVGLITSKYYEIILNRDKQAFGIEVIKSLLLIFAIAAAKSAQSYSASSAYICVRSTTCHLLHALYFAGTAFYDINVLPQSKPLPGNEDESPEEPTERARLKPANDEDSPDDAEERDVGRTKYRSTDPSKTSPSIKIKIKIQDSTRTGNVIDNPDQRITADVEQLSRNVVDILPSVIVLICKAGYYSYASWMIVGWVGPVGSFVFFLVCTLVNKFIMSPIVGLIYDQERREGDFRFQHMHIRSEAESIALISAGRTECIVTNSRLHRLIHTQQRVIRWRFFLDLATNFADYTGSIVSYAVLALPLFAGVFSDLTPSKLGALISANAFITMTLISCFTNMLDLSSKTTTLASTTHRVEQLFEDLESRSESRSRRNSTSKPSRSDSPDSPNPDLPLTEELRKRKNYFIFKDVTIGRPVGRDDQKLHPASSLPLVNQLDLCIYREMKLLISGTSGAGKTALVRALKGLWQPSSGVIFRYLPVDCPSVVLFLPQKPVLLLRASLRQQITYPTMRLVSGDFDELLATSSPETTSSNISVSETDQFTYQGLHERTRPKGTLAVDRQLEDILAFLNLGAILDRVSGDLDLIPDFNWTDSLSPGELQLINFARLFHHMPLVAILDEATSALSTDMEAKIYGRLAELRMTIISIGHRSSLRKYHDFELHLVSDQSLDGSARNLNLVGSPLGTHSRTMESLVMSSTMSLPTINWVLRNLSHDK